MRHILTGAALALGLVLCPAAAETAPANPHPWENAQALLDTVMQDFNSKGFAGLSGHVAEMEAALADANASFQVGPEPDGTVIVLTDGPMESLLALAAAAAEKNPAMKGRKTVAIDNPYPMLALVLGSYYNETSRVEDAERVLAKGMTLFAVPSLGLGDHAPALAGEHALALARLGRMDDALAAYDKALKLPAAKDTDKARFQRGRGYVLTELNRLDEAEAAYRESLKLEPGNQIAQRELNYIAGLRQGSEKTSTEIVAPNAPKPKTD
jgi:tetratricopeptide (TPR) repeat protein